MLEQQPRQLVTGGGELLTYLVTATPDYVLERAQEARRDAERTTLWGSLPLERRNAARQSPFWQRNPTSYARD